MFAKHVVSHDHTCCSEHCDDYLQLLQELIEAENTIEELQQHIIVLEDLLNEHNA